MINLLLSHMPRLVLHPAYAVQLDRSSGLTDEQHDFKMELWLFFSLSLTPATSWSGDGARADTY